MHLAQLAGAPLVLAVFLAPMTRLRFSSAVTYADPFFVLATGIAFVAILKSRMRIVSPVLIIAFALLYFPTPYHASRQESLQSLIQLSQFVLAASVIPIVVAGSCHCLKLRPQWLIYAFIIGVALSAMSGISNHHGHFFLGLFWDPFSINKWTDFRVSGLSHHPNALAMTCAIALPLAIGQFLSARQRLHQLCMLGLILTMLYALNLTGSRTGLAVAVITSGGLVAAVLLRSGRRRASKLALFLVIAGTIGMGLLAGTIGGKTSTALERILYGSERASEARGAIASQTFEEVAKEPWFGRGYHRISFAHNYFIQMLHSGGMFALLGILLVFGTFLSWIWRLRGAYAAGSSDWLLYQAIAFSVGAWMLSGAFQNAISDRFVYVPVGLILALNLAFFTRRATDSGPTNSWPTRANSAHDQYSMPA